ncbi:hypothetical protein BDV23DRAFT_109418 [Aspergillus alliaceus]|uniref:Uncharacterized protein n=1 Tax=Petromyces alliaceus TaxID=209559 RepID=A0A5N7C4U4_PETAA|nr:hypothetical protein BDV23DRAFT_109418 [Aspergillus alliaceus]
MVFKGRSGDTSWFSIFREEWNTTLKQAMEKGLYEGNSQADGSQERSLQVLRTECMASGEYGSR